MAQINVVIDGLAICYFEKNQGGLDGVWRVFVPKFSDHDFLITVTRKSPNASSSSMRFSVPLASKITLSTDSLTVGSREPAFLDKTIDICDARFHGNNSIGLTPNREKYAGFISLPGISLQSVDGYIEEGNYRVWKVTPFDNPQTKERIIESIPIRSGISNASKNVNEGDVSRLTIIDQLGNFPQTDLSITHEEDVEYEFRFTNLCTKDERDNQTEFRFYYSIITGNTSNFELHPHEDPQRCRQPGCSSVLAESLTNFDELKAFF